ncbi:MAG TPA: hypothetical protein VKE23_10715 [Candidatus Limnocylindria bacterium]|nr:hypothetical protein [Candidatus Limnocylindria bacterium]
MATTRTPEQQDAFAVVRLDSFRNFTPRPENVSVRRVVHHFAEAELEVRHLNMTAPTGTVYFIQRTTVAPRIEPVVVAPPSPVVAIAEAILGPLSTRSRRARAEKKAGKKKPKKGKRK